MNSSDKVKKIVQTEGRTARNLVIYNVPVQPNAAGSGGVQAGMIFVKKKWCYTNHFFLHLQITMPF